MQFANYEGERVEATPGAQAECPLCESEVLARCGQINAWHWAHKKGGNCDTWSEGESEWHLNWKKRFPHQWREYIIGFHRADIKSPRGVIELQGSSISSVEIEDREHFYGEMIWVVNAQEFNLDIRDRGTHVTFRWKNPRKTWWCADKPLYFDVGDRLIAISRIYEDIPCGGSGKYVSYAEFVAMFSRPKPNENLCDGCMMPFATRDLIETDLYEYYTMDIDPGTMMCNFCYEKQREQFIPDDPSLYDCYTPVRIG